MSLARTSQNVFWQQEVHGKNAEQITEMHAKLHEVFPKSFFASGLGKSQPQTSPNQLELFGSRSGMLIILHKWDCRSIVDAPAILEISETLSILRRHTSSHLQRRVLKEGDVLGKCICSARAEFTASSLIMLEVEAHNEGSTKPTQRIMHTRRWIALKNPPVHIRAQPLDARSNKIHEPQLCQQLRYMVSPAATSPPNPVLSKS